MKAFVFGVSENDELVGIICGYIVSDGSKLKRYLSRRAIVPGGILLNSNISALSIECLLNRSSKIISKEAIYLEIRNYNDFAPFRKSIENSKFEYKPHLNFHVSTPDAESALMKLNTTKRRDVRLSRKEGAEWYETKDRAEVKTLYFLLKKLYESKIRTPLFPLEFFEGLLNVEEAKIFVVKFNGEIIGGSVCVVLPNKTLYEWFVCGLDGKYKNIFPSTFATWAAIEYAAINEYARFDMMGAGKPDEGYGVREFKSKFGGELVEHGRYIRIFHSVLYRIGILGVNYYKNRNVNVKVEKSPKAILRIENRYEKIDKTEWANFVQNHPQGGIFQTPKMFEVYLKTPDFTPEVLVALDEKGFIVGCLMSIIKSDFFILRGFTTRSIVMGGPLAINNDEKIIDLLLSSYNRLIASKSIFTQFRNQFDVTAFKSVFKKNGYVFEEHLDIFLDLSKSKADLEQSLHKERRRNIAQAEKEGLIFKHLTTDREIIEVSGLLKKTYNRVKLPMIFQKLFLNTKELLGAEVNFFGAYYGDILIAGQVRLYYKDLVYAWYSGSNSAYFKKRPNDFLMWNVLLWSKDKGYKLFDFGGAGKPNVPYGVREYKMKYGGEMVNYGRFEKVHKPFLMRIGKKALKYYKYIKK